jgi:glycosyltransferase involved in cell wall biosynthesis
LDGSTTVVITTRNRLGYLREAVATALNQGACVREVVVVDDASEDGTWGWLSGLNDPRVRPIRMDKHSERGAGRNVGLEAAAGRYITFLDDDDHLLRGSTRRLIAALEGRPGVAFVVGGRIVFNDQGHRRRARGYPRIRLTRNLTTDVIAGWGAGVGQWLAPTETVRRIGGWDAKLITSEEWEIFLRLSAEGPAVLIPQAVLAERMHPGQWEPEYRDRVMDEIREGFIGTLEGRRRLEAEAVFRAHALEMAAAQAYGRGDYKGAAAGYVRTFAAAPALLRSPLTAPKLLKTTARASAGAVVGSRGAEGVRGLIRTSRRALKRETDSGWRALPVAARLGEEGPTDPRRSANGGGPGASTDPVTRDVAQSSGGSA